MVFWRMESASEARETAIGVLADSLEN